MESRYFKVTCKCGHVGRGYFIRIDFPVMAGSGKEAAAIAREIPRVKHHHKDAILACTEITPDEFEALREKNKYDPYLRCENPQEQSMIFDLHLRLEPEAGRTTAAKTSRRDSAQYRRRKQLICEEEAWDYDEDELAFDLMPALA